MSSSRPKANSVQVSPAFLGLGQKVTAYADAQFKTIAKLCEKQGYSLVESFSGPGGMSLGLGWAGFQKLIAFDYDAATVATHNRNLGACFQADARTVVGKDLLKGTSVRKGGLDLFAGGPPCQGFSKQKRGAHLGDERNDLVFEYVRLVNELSPRFFLFENVAIFGQLRGKKYLEEMRLRLPDYRFFPHFFNAADYGLPQTRERFVLVGQRRDIKKSSYLVPGPTTKKWRTVGDVLHGLPEPISQAAHPDYFNHALSFVTAINIERFSYVPQGGGWKDIPMHLRLPCHREENTKTGGWPDVYGRLRWDGQCPTITGGFDSFTRGRYGHPLTDRPITAREAARIQGFPDAFEFLGTRGDIRSQIGNVVPPPLAEAVGLQIAHCLLVEDGLLDAPKGMARSAISQPDLFEAA